MIKNNFFYGLIWGIVLPLLVFGLFFLFNYALKFNETANISFRDSTVVLFSICANLIPVIYANKRLMDEFIRGIMFPTFLGSVTWFFYFDPIELF
jgi:hypothetical protein